VSENLPEKIYTEADVARGRRNAKMMGRLQGGAVVFLGGVALQFVSWVPILIGVGVVGYVGYKLLTRGSKDGDADE
jgi:hypothetical protein